MQKYRTVKQAMNSDSVKLVKIYAKHNKEIRLDFAPRYANSGAKFQSFWINRDYFKRNYPNAYNKH